MRGPFQSRTLTLGLAATALGLLPSPALAWEQDSPAATPPEPILIESVAWRRPPMPEFPARGLSIDSDGRVVLQCGFLQTGTVMDCVIEQETPLDAGFGPAALAAAGEARLASRFVQGADPRARVRFVIQFRVAR